MAQRGMLRKAADRSIRSHFPVLPTTRGAEKVAGGMSLRRDLSDTYAHIRTQLGLLKGQSIQQHQQTVREGQAGLQSQAGSSLERGMLGSSVSNIQRALMKRDTSSALLDIKNQRVSAEMGLASQAQQATRDYRTGLLNLMMAEKAELSDQAIADMLSNANGGGGGGGRGRRGRGGESNNNGNKAAQPSFTERIADMSAKELNDLKSKMTNRMQNRWGNLEGKGWDVYHGKGGKVFMQQSVPQEKDYIRRLNKYLTRLNRRRTLIKGEVTGRDANGASQGR